MAKDQQKRLRLKFLSNDQENFDALKGIENLASLDEAYTLDNVQRLHDTMLKAQADEAQAHANYKSQRDNATEAEWAFHNAILASKNNVLAQFGKDSNEVQAMGLKKSVDYKRPQRRKVVPLNVAA